MKKNSYLTDSNRILRQSACEVSILVVDVPHRQGR